MAPSGSSRASRKRGERDPHLRELALAVVRLGEDALGLIDLAQSHQRSNQVAGDARGEHVRLDEQLAQSLGGAKGAQRLRIAAVRRLEHAAHRVKHQPPGG